MCLSWIRLQSEIARVQMEIKSVGADKKLYFGGTGVTLVESATGTAEVRTIKYCG